MKTCQSIWAVGDTARHGIACLAVRTDSRLGSIMRPGSGLVNDDLVTATPTATATAQYQARSPRKR